MQRLIAKITFNESYFRTARLRNREHRGAFGVVVALRWLVGVVLLLAAMISLDEGKWVDAVVKALLALLAFLAGRFEGWLALRNFWKSPYRDEELRLTFSAAGFHALSDKQDVRLSWDVFTEVAHFKDGFLLYQGPKLYNWVPYAAFDESGDVMPVLIDLLKANVEKHEFVDGSGG